jgi:hypothetical protein
LENLHTPPLFFVPFLYLLCFYLVSEQPGVFVMGAVTDFVSVAGLPAHSGTAEPKPAAVSEALEAMAALQANSARTSAINVVKAAPAKREGRQGQKWTAEEDDAVIALFEAGHSAMAIARAQKRSWVAIVARLERLGYVPRDLRLSDFEGGRTPPQQLTLQMERLHR